MPVATRSQRSRDNGAAQAEQIPDLLQARPGMSDSIKTAIFVALFIAALASMAFVFLNFPPMRQYEILPSVFEHFSVRPRIFEPIPEFSLIFHSISSKKLTNIFLRCRQGAQGPSEVAQVDW